MGLVPAGWRNLELVEHSKYSALDYCSTHVLCTLRDHHCTVLLVVLNRFPLPWRGARATVFRLETSEAIVRGEIRFAT